MMGATLVKNRYGKSRVRLMRVTRQDDHNDVDEWTVQILLMGDFEAAHTQGDNAKILATDTMKNTVYFVARQSQAASMEAYALELIEYILSRNPQVSAAEVQVASAMWKRVTVEGKPDATTFMRGSAEQQTTTVLRAQGMAATVTSGLQDLTIMKTANSGFAGYIKEPLTTLPETTDRLFATALEAQWPYTPEALVVGVDFNKVRAHLRAALLETFAKHESLSVQQTLFAMAEAALAHTDVIAEISMRMPNKHQLPVDLKRFGSDNPNHIFVPTDEPHGTIEATVRR